ncbi:sigma-70 family RNA polymerase sigma factor [Roseimicrobium gellanilyticum]|nr:sigma-70 family RNA polymerase sigma factor [Roseimicrobium gellanilyticum]
MPEITLLLESMKRGEPHAADALMQEVYEELRRLARAKLARESSEHTLQSTALVHEAWMRLGDASFENRAHFFSAAAEAMRRILIDRARRRISAKHHPAAGHVPVDDLDIEAPGLAEEEELLAVHEALDALSQHDARVAELVKLRYFVGLTIDDTADVLGISPASVKREWTYARAWLFRNMSAQ